MREESKSYQEADWLRAESLSRYNAQRVDLNKRKERLFKRKDVTEWGCPADQMRAAMDTLNDAEAAFGYMLPNASKQVNYLGEESAFFTTQCFKETRRTTMINYTMAREHFIDMGEQVHKHIYDLNLAWGQFLDFYSDLNNARKAHEDNFMERNYIGEELVEPDEKPVNNMELIDNFGASIDIDNYGEDQRQDKGDKSDFYEAFDDGFENVKRGGDSKAPVQDGVDRPVANLLGDLQREIREEETAAASSESQSTSVALLAEDKIEDDK